MQSVSSSPDSDNDESFILLRAYDPAFEAAITSRTFNACLPGPSCFPHAVLQTKSVEGVRNALAFCQSQKLQACVRSGGHSWEACWLQGKGTVLLDVGDLDTIQVKCSTSSDATTQCYVEAGPGAKGIDVLTALLPKDYFFPCGHCQGVPLGGFLLGGGYGLGFPKYGMACSLVAEVQVVLATGQVVTASEETAQDDPISRAILKLVRGSYSSFPGVVTKYTLGPLPRRPQGVLTGALLFDLNKWRNALQVGMNIAYHSADDDAQAIEVTIILQHAPESISARFQVGMVACVSLTIWAETEQQGRELWNKHAVPHASETLMPLEDPSHCQPQNLPALISQNYPPGTRYQSEVFMGDSSVLQMPRNDLEAILEPVANLWLSPRESKPPPPSHTLLVCAHKHLEQTHEKDKDLALGYLPLMGVQSYAIYSDPKNDGVYRDQLARAHQKCADSPTFKLSLVEGHTRSHGTPSGYTDQAYAEAQECIRLLDPNGVFARKL